MSHPSPGWAFRALWARGPLHRQEACLYPLRPKRLHTGAEGTSAHGGFVCPWFGVGRVNVWLCPGRFVGWVVGLEDSGGCCWWWYGSHSFCCEGFRSLSEGRGEESPAVSAQELCYFQVGREPQTRRARAPHRKWGRGDPAPSGGPGLRAPTCVTSGNPGADGEPCWFAGSQLCPGGGWEPGESPLRGRGS